MIDINPAWIALIGTIFGGAGLKVIEKWLNSSAQKDQSAVQIRAELRLQIESLKDDLEVLKTDRDTLELEIVEWKKKYWDLVSDHNKMQVELLTALSKLKLIAETEQAIKAETRPDPPDTPPEK